MVARERLVGAGTVAASLARRSVVMDDGTVPNHPDPGRAHQPDVDAQDRDELADRRDLSGDERDTSSEQRDSSGDRRDHALELLDDEADRADDAATQRDHIASTRAEGYENGRVDPQLAQQSAADREHSRLDRERAERDRHAGAAERVEARLDRSTASTDRTAALDDRSQAGHDRSTALDDRRKAAVARDIATFDELTGTYRRGAGLVELDREIARTDRTHDPLVLAFVDVDGLKVVNDSRGHEAGDRLLIDVADALISSLRPYDMVVRYGGDEFLCICQGMTEADTDIRLTAVNDTLAASGGSISVGLAQLRAGETSAACIARADRALYRNRGIRRGTDGSGRSTDRA